MPLSFRYRHSLTGVELLLQKSSGEWTEEPLLFKDKASLFSSDCPGKVNYRCCDH